MTASKTNTSISLLGSTGSIGTSTLEVVRRHRERFTVLSLAAGGNIELLKDQILEFRPRVVSVKDGEHKVRLKSILESSPDYGSYLSNLKILTGTDGNIAVATCSGVDTCISAITGAAGLLPTYEAINAGINIGLANKESLVLAGSIMMDLARKNGVSIIPVDSEHSAVFQSMNGNRREDLRKIILTASGGPFLNLPKEEFSGVTPEVALDHPKWDMGRKISIDSATLLNKGLEVIEARWLFGLEPHEIEVVIHPQSIVHSMVEYKDGSVIAQLSEPDMKGPISYALTYPERIDNIVAPLSLQGLTLDFLPPDLERFPCLGLAFRVMALEGTAPAVLNGADEVLVEAFLEGEIPFTAIPELLGAVVEEHVTLIGNPPRGDESRPPLTIDDVIEADRWGREEARKAIEGLEGA